MKSSYFLLSFLLTVPLAVADTPAHPAALVEDVVEHHPELRYYEAELAAARGARKAAATWNDPELSLEVGRKRAYSPAGLLEGEGTVWSVSLSQTFEWPGRVALRKAMANRDVELAELGLARFRAALASRAQTLAFGLYAEATKAAAVREVADRFRALKETFLARDPAGLTPLLETRVIEAQELAIQRRATEAEIAWRNSLTELNQLRGAPLETEVRVSATRLDFGEAPSSDALLSAARQNHFEYRARLLELEQQGFVVQLARNERYPAITVSPFFSQETAGERERVAGIGVSLPLPLGNRSRTEVDTAEARRRQAEAAVRMAERDMERELISVAYTFAAKRAEAARWSPESVDKFREAAALADRHYRLGAVPLATYVELQTAYLEAVEALLGTQREALEAGLRLQLLTGLDFNAVKLSQP